LQCAACLMVAGSGAHSLETYCSNIATNKRLLSQRVATRNAPEQKYRDSGASLARSKVLSYKVVIQRRLTAIPLVQKSFLGGAHSKEGLMPMYSQQRSLNKVVC
jgi:hypothetical protein